MQTLIDLLKTLTSSMQNLMGVVIALVAVVIGGMCVVKAVQAFQKQDYKAVAIWALCAVGAFVISALGIGAFMDFGNTVGGNGTSGITNLITTTP